MNDAPCGPSMLRLVNRTAVRSWDGSFHHTVPRPPTHPYEPGERPSLPDARRTSTPYPHPMSSSAAMLTHNGANWSVVIAATDRSLSTLAPPDDNARPNASMSATVETSPPPPLGNRGGADHWPSGSSYTRRPPLSPS